MRRMRVKAVVAIIATATVFQLGPQGCLQFGAYQALSLFDFCGVLNCTQGTFFNFCQPNATLLDCPQQQAANP
ncbi:MAG: hypothetical protein KDA32_10475 [Phycisphaerales bacterium]|nr:hypothetical protein [Phycisphaerales bacterium]